jgi:two-component system alkaline phosphatase synthesis response regulator PhoP
MPKELVLLVDDEPNIIKLARLYLEREGYTVISEGDGESALECIERKHPSILILDIMLPKLDGWEVCRQLRSEGNRIPIIMLTARDEDIDKILGLELGADDYLTKPFNPRELVARIKAILRRTLSQPQLKPNVKRLLDLEIDPARREVWVNGIPIDLRTQEFEVLWVMVQHQGFVLSREKLLQLAWGYDYAGETRTVDVHIGHLRKKIAESKIKIETVSGVGYKLIM